MAAFDSYDTLRLAIGDWLNRGDLDARIPDFITLAEADIRADLESRNVTHNTALAVTTGSTTLPTDIKILRSLYRQDPINGGPITLVSPEDIAHFRTLYPQAGYPRVAAVVAGKLLLAPAPDGAYALEIIYEPDIPALSGTTTNWLLQKHPNVYLYGALRHAAPYLKDDERVALWHTGYQDHIDKLARAKQRYEFGAGPLGTK